MMVYLGPQLVQLIKGYSNLRSPGSDISARQSGQMLTSGEIRVNLVWESRLFTIWNVENPCTGSTADLMAVIRLNTGFFKGISRTKASRPDRGPSITRSTPWAVLDTCPFKPWVLARPNKNGRNPTP